MTDCIAYYDGRPKHIETFREAVRLLILSVGAFFSWLFGNRSFCSTFCLRRCIKVVNIEQTVSAYIVWCWRYAHLLFRGVINWWSWGRHQSLTTLQLDGILGGAEFYYSVIA